MTKVDKKDDHPMSSVIFFLDTQLNYEGTILQRAYSMPGASTSLPMADHILRIHDRIAHLEQLITLAHAYHPSFSGNLKSAQIL
jgi:hypothetical protein